MLVPWLRDSPCTDCDKELLSHLGRFVRVYYRMYHSWQYLRCVYIYIYIQGVQGTPGVWGEINYLCNSWAHLCRNNLIPAGLVPGR